MFLMIKMNNKKVRTMRTLKESGLILVKEGKTTPEELLKISYE